MDLLDTLEQAQSGPVPLLSAAGYHTIGIDTSAQHLVLLAMLTEF